MRAAGGVVVKLSSPVWVRARQIIVDLNIYNFNNSLVVLQQQLAVWEKYPQLAVLFPKKDSAKELMWEI